MGRKARALALLVLIVGGCAWAQQPAATPRTAPVAQPTVPVSPRDPAPAALPPIGTDTSTHQLLALHTRAVAMKPEVVQEAIAHAASGSTEAMLLLGYFYRDQNDATKSQQWFAEASKGDDPLAWAAYGFQLPPEQPGKREWLSKAADQHVGIAETLLALMWLIGAGGPPQVEQGRQMLFRAAQDGDPIALILGGAYSLGLAENEGTRGDVLDALGIRSGTLGPMFAKDIPRGKLYLETAAARGEPDAKQYLQQAYMLAILTDPNPSKPNVAAGVKGQAPAPSQLQVDGKNLQQNLVSQVPPVYPAVAKSAHIQGTVVLRVIISTDGTARELQCVSGPALLQQAAIDAVRQWKYRPVLINAEPVEVLSTVSIIFNLAAPSSSGNGGQQPSSGGGVPTASSSADNSSPLATNALPGPLFAGKSCSDVGAPNAEGGTFIEGVVKDSVGTPIVGAFVMVVRGNGVGYPSGRTDNHGSYFFTGSSADKGTLTLRQVSAGRDLDLRPIEWFDGKDNRFDMNYAGLASDLPWRPEPGDFSERNQPLRP